MEPGVVPQGAAVVEAAVAVLDDPGDGALDRWRHRRYSACQAGSVAAWRRAAACWSWSGRMVRMRPALALVQRSHCGHPVHRCPKVALRCWCCPRGGASSTVWPWGQVTVLPVVSMAKAAGLVNVPGLGVDGGEHPVGGGAPGAPPAEWTSCRPGSTTRPAPARTPGSPGTARSARRPSRRNGRSRPAGTPLLRRPQQHADAG